MDKAETHRQQIAERQQQFEDLRQRNGELEGTVTELRLQFERSQRELHELHSRHAQPKALKSAKSRKPSKVTASAQDMSR
ncbi:MAG: hypothetical protein ABIO73_15100 [Polaromonas sp.]